MGDVGKDTDVTNDKDPQSSGYSPFDPGDVTDSIPFYSTGKSVVGDVNNLTDGSEVSGDIADIALQVTGLAGDIGMLLFDPIGWLTGALLSFVIDLVQPLEDLLGLVTGNPERMDGEIGKWARVRAALEPMAEQVGGTADGELKSWEGDASAIAKQRLKDFGTAIGKLIGNIATLEAILGLAKALASVLQDLIKSEISSLISNWIMDWILATATAGPTFGGSFAVAAANMLLKFSMTMLRVVMFLQKGMKVFQATLRIIKQVSAMIEQLGRWFAVIKAVPGVLGKVETALTTDHGGDGSISAAMQ